MICPLPTTSRQLYESTGKLPTVALLTCKSPCVSCSANLGKVVSWRWLFLVGVIVASCLFLLFPHETFPCSFGGVFIFTVLCGQFCTVLLLLLFFVLYDTFSIRKIYWCVPFATIRLFDLYPFRSFFPWALLPTRLSLSSGRSGRRG